MDKYFRYISNLMTKKSIKYLMVIFVIAGYLFFLYKNNSVELNEKMKMFNDKKKQIKLTKNIKTKEDLEDFINKNKSVIFEVEEKKIKLEENQKTELISDEKQMPDLKTEEMIKQPMSLAYKLQDLEKYYQKRKKEKKINYNREVKFEDIIYFNLKVRYVVKGMLELKEEDIEGSSTMIVLEKKLPFSKFFVGKKVKDIVRFTAEEMIQQMSKEERKVFEEQKKQIDGGIKQEKNVEIEQYVDMKGIHFSYTILDIFPKSVIKELKLDK